MRVRRVAVGRAACAPRRGRRGARGETFLEGVVERITFESAESSFRVLKLAVPGAATGLPSSGRSRRWRPARAIRVRGRIVVDKQARRAAPRRVASSSSRPTRSWGSRTTSRRGSSKASGPSSRSASSATFGLASLEVLDEEPHRLAEVEGLGAKRTEALVKTWREQRALRDVMVFLQAHGASPALATRIVEAYGAAAMTSSRDDPYRLALDVHGVGFKTADRIAASIGVAPDSPERMQAGVLQAVHDATRVGARLDRRAASSRARVGPDAGPRRRRRRR